MVLEGPEFQKFFDYVEVANFEVASDAFTTFKVQGVPRLKTLGAAACEDSRGVAVPVCRALGRSGCMAPIGSWWCGIGIPRRSRPL